MPTLCRSYMTDDDANAAVERLLTAGLAVDEIRVLMGEPARDGREARTGDFAGSTTRSAASPAARIRPPN